VGTRDDGAWAWVPMRVVSSAARGIEGGESGEWVGLGVGIVSGGRGA
jgi:hypothetical protein